MIECKIFVIADLIMRHNKEVPLNIVLRYNTRAEDYDFVIYTIYS